MTNLLRRVYEYMADHYATETIDEQNVDKTEPTPAPVCENCKYKSDNERKLKIHIQTIHQDVKVKLTEGIKPIKCDVCKYTCKFNIQLKKHKKKHGENQANTANNIKDNQPMLAFGCDLCDFGADLVTEIWKHKLDKHISEYPSFNNLDEGERQSHMYNFVAEQNADLIREFKSLKKGIKEVFEQMIEEFGDSIKDVKKESQIQLGVA